MKTKRTIGSVRKGTSPRRRVTFWATRDMIGDDPNGGDCKVFVGKRPKKGHCDYRDPGCCTHWCSRYEVYRRGKLRHRQILVNSTYDDFRVMFPDVELKPGECKKVFLLAVEPVPPARKKK